MIARADSTNSTRTIRFRNLSSNASEDFSPVHSSGNVNEGVNTFIDIFVSDFDTYILFCS